MLFDRCRFSGLLSMTDFDLLFPHQAQFLCQLSAIVAQRKLIEADASLTDDAKWEKVRQLTIGDSSTTIDDIGCDDFFIFYSLIVIFASFCIELHQNWLLSCTDVSIRNCSYSSHFVASYCCVTFFITGSHFGFGSLLAFCGQIWQGIISIIVTHMWAKFVRLTSVLFSVFQGWRSFLIHRQKFTTIHSLNWSRMVKMRYALLRYFIVINVFPLSSQSSAR